jgi:hypothetical protein
LVSAGGAEEEMASPAVLLQVEDFLFGGGVRWSSAADLPPRPCWLLCGAAVCGFPFAGCCGMADLASTVVQEVGEVRFDDDGVRWCRSSVAGARRLPVRSGELSIQGVKESRSGGAPPTAPWTTTWSGCSEAWTVFFVSARVLSVIC